MFNFKFTVMREPDLQRITVLGFRIFKIFQNFKTTFGYYLSNFCVLISMFSFCTKGKKYRRENWPEKHSGTSLFLVKILETFLYTWRMANKFSWFYQPNLVEIRRDFCFRDGKSCITLCHIPLTVKEFRYTLFTFPNKQCMTSLIKDQE